MEQKLKENINVSHRVSHQLVNVYFTPYNEDVAFIKVELYLLKEENINISKERQFMIENIIERNVGYTVFNNLAWGRYSYKMIQEDKFSNVIISSEFKDFYIRKPIYKENTNF